MIKEVLITGEDLSVNDIVAVARDNAKVAIALEAQQRVKLCRSFVKKLVSSRQMVYGITTGLGYFSKVKIPINKAKALQENYIRSNAAGLGESLPCDVTRATMLIRANSLAKGYSGIRLSTLEQLTNMLNYKVHPIIPEKGTVGASGDLAPLAHMVLGMMGVGNAEYSGQVMDAAVALDRVGISKLKLDFREGVALINSTAVMTAIAALAVYDSQKLIRKAEIIAASSLEALEGMSEAFDERTHRLRPYIGQIASAGNIRKLIAGSRLVKSIKGQHETVTKVQDAYTLRCIPQVMGAVRDAVAYVDQVTSIEVNSASDNPLFFVKDEEAVHGGNFHGQQIATVMDLLGIALTPMGDISERRIARLVDPNLNGGMPAFLALGAEGQQCGLVGAVLAATSLSAENRTLTTAASVQSIPTSVNGEDHVSMGTIAARQATDILRNIENIIGIELLCAMQAIDFRGSEKVGLGTKEAYNVVRKNISKWAGNGVLSADIEQATEIVRGNALLEAVEEVVGKLA